MLTPRDTAKFGLLVGLCAIFIDAVIAHGLFWENDPYWTYWITKSFLISTVFIIGTAFFGIGLVQGLVLTLVHTLVLEIYYQFFAPVGLPQEPEWLDFNHLWITGFPVHYLSILIGYLMARWVWLRGPRPEREPDETPPAGATALGSLTAVVLILFLSGIITHGVLMGAFPGVTYFIQHLLVGFVFVYLWSAYVGMAGAGWAVGALMLALTWTAYGMYLGPLGLPADPPRYLGYQELWLKAFPGDLISALAGFWFAQFILPRIGRRSVVLASSFLAIGLVAAPENAQAKGLKATASAAGQAVQVTGPNPVDMNRTRPVEGTIEIEAHERGNRWSHVQNMDDVRVIAAIAAPDGNYRVEVDKAMPRHPLGWYTTWNGVAFNHGMHGETGIGTPKLPKMTPAISIYGWGKVTRDGQPIAAMAPVHVMVTEEGPMKGVMLEVDTEGKGLRDVPDGYLTVMWPQTSSLVVPRERLRNREIAGWIGLAGLLLLFLFLNRSPRRSERRSE